MCSPAWRLHSSLRSSFPSPSLSKRAKTLDQTRRMHSLDGTLCGSGDTDGWTRLTRYSNCLLMVLTTMLLPLAKKLRDTLAYSGSANAGNSDCASKQTRSFSHTCGEGLSADILEPGMQPPNNLNLPCLPPNLELHRISRRVQSACPAGCWGTCVTGCLDQSSHDLNITCWQGVTGTGTLRHRPCWPPPCLSTSTRKTWGETCQINYI